jgi:hypothetical protein
VVFTIGLSGVPHAAWLDAPAEDLVPRLSVGGRALAEVVDGLAPLRDGDGDGGPPAVAARTSADGGGGWPLAVAPDGAVTDALGGEIALVRGGRIELAPAPGPRTVVAAHLAELGVEIAKRPFSLDDLRAADEAFVAGLPFCVVTLASIDGEELGKGDEARRVAAAWSESVGADLLPR